LLSFSLISFASDDIKVMNSTQHSIRRSRASLPNARPELDGRISVTIFWTVAREDVSLWFVSIFEVIDESQRRSPGIAHELPTGASIEDPQRIVHASRMIGEIDGESPDCPQEHDEAYQRSSSGKRGYGR
jgi:hypothetical protein